MIWYELIKADLTQTGGPRWSGPTFVPTSDNLKEADRVY